MRVKYLPYPPLQKVHYYCPDCGLTMILFSYYPDAVTAEVTHQCRRTRRPKRMLRR